jgi:hypothetical protein
LISRRRGIVRLQGRHLDHPGCWRLAIPLPRTGSSAARGGRSASKR